MAKGSTLRNRKKVFSSPEKKPELIVEKDVEKQVTTSPFYASPLYDFLSPFKPVSFQWAAKYLIVLCAILLRSSVSLGSYSGEATPPMFGDFEAQRHWLEITTELPISKWYWYDLGYWGLDYPPLTAYHSWCLGKFGKLLQPLWFALDSSRGMETMNLKSYMRFTVIISDLLFYFPAVIYFAYWIGKQTKQSAIDQYIVVAAVLFQPSLLLIDHGHFQYNSVMLGLTVYAINNLLDDFYAPAAICFVLSLCFKQMALYYSPIFFGYLLSRSIFYSGFNLPRLFVIGMATILSFVAMFGPLYIFGDYANVVQAIARIFPFSRGLFEDKVANFWCVTNTIIKYKVLLTPSDLQFYSLVCTLAGFFPALVIIFLYPKKHLLPYALTACSMSFFLFSFQVHEKTILLPLLPITLLFTSNDLDVLSMVSWINNIALFSLWPLIKKDNLIVQYAVLFLVYNWLLGNFTFITPTFLPSCLTPRPSITEGSKVYRRRSLLPKNLIWKVIIVGSYVAVAIAHYLDFFHQPPVRYNDLWVILNCTISFGCFVLFWLWNYYKLFTMRNKTFKQY